MVQEDIERITQLIEAGLGKVCTAYHTQLVSDHQKLRTAVAQAGFGVMQTSGDWSIHDISEKAKANVDLAICVEKLVASLTELLDAMDADDHYSRKLYLLSRTAHVVLAEAVATLVADHAPPTERQKR